MCMSGRETTEREPRERGCSGSEIVDMRSKISCSSMGSDSESSSLSNVDEEIDESSAKGSMTDRDATGFENILVVLGPVRKEVDLRVGRSDGLRMVGVAFIGSADDIAAI